MLDVGINQAVGSLTGAGTVTNSVPTAPTLTVGGDNSSQTFSGLLQDGSGTLAVVKTGNGMWTLSGNNNYSGATTLNSGTLQLGNGGPSGSLGSGGLAITASNNTWLSFNRSDSPTAFPYVITSGTVSQDGSGMTTLALNNSYTGGTIISNGTLQVGNGGGFGSLGSGPVVNNGTLVLTRSDGFFTVPNTLSGPGSLYHNGSGTTSLTGPASTFTGPIYVNNGSLFINSVNNASGITVQSGALLGGSGTVSVATANVFSGGIVAGGDNSGNGSFTLHGLSLGGNVGLDFSDIGNYPTTGTQGAAIDVTGSNDLTASGGAGSVTFYLLGQFPTNTSPQTSHLIQYSGSLPGALHSVNLNKSNLTGYGAGSHISLVYTDPGYIDATYYTNYPIWTGLNGGIWDTYPAGSPTDGNWKQASNGSPTVFSYGDVPVFDDSAGTAQGLPAGSSINVYLNGTGASNSDNSYSPNVDPTSVTFSNSAYNYVLSGSNSIEGSNVALTISSSGNGSVTITNSNTYGGVTTLNSGRLVIDNLYALGQAENGATLVLNGGTIDNDAPLTIDNYPINWNRPFTFAGRNFLDLGSGGVTLTTTGAAVNVSGSTLQIDGAIGDNGLGYGFTQNGAGVLLLTASNTYLGPTVVNGGTLQIGNGGSGASIGATSNVVLAANTLLLFNQNDSQTFGASIGGSGSMTQMGVGSLLNLTNSNTYTGGTTVASGSLELSFGGPAGTLAPNSTVIVNSGAALLLNVSNALGTSGSYTNLSVNSGGLVFANSGYRVPLYSVNMTGGALASAAGIGDGNGNYSLGGTLSATSDASGNPAAITATQVSLVSNSVLNVSHGGAASPTDLLVTSVITSFPGGTGLTLQGNGFTQFTAANTYNGGTNVNGGTLQLASGTATLGASTGSLTLASGALLDINGVNTSVGGLNGNGTIDNVYGTLGLSPTLTVGNGNAGGTFSGTIQNTVNGGATMLAKVGNGAQFLSGTNTYAGGTTITAGVLNFTSSALGSNKVIFNGGTLQWATGNTSDVSTSPGIANIASGKSAKLDTNGNSVQFNTGFGGAGGLTKTGAGTLTLAVPNTFGGGTSITGGTLNLADPLALQNSTATVSINNSLVLSGAATSSVTLGGLSGAANFNLGVASINVGQNNATTTYSGVLGGGSNLTKQGTGSLLFISPLSYTGSTTVSQGTLAVAPTTPPEMLLNFNGTTADSSGNYNSATLVGGPSFGTGNVPSTQAISFNGTNQYVTVPNSRSLSLTGAYTVSLWEQGNLVSATSASQGGPALISTRNGGNNNDFDLQVNSAGLHGDIGNGTSFLTSSANATVALGSGWNMITLAVTTTGYAIYVNGGQVSNGTLSGTPVFLTSSSANVSLGSQEAGGGSYGQGFGSGYFNGTLSQVEVFSSALSAAQIASLYNATNAALNSAPNAILPATSPLSVAGGATLNMGAAQTVVSLSGAGTVTNSYANTTAILTAGGDNSSQIFSGALRDGAGAVGLVKVGAGNLTLSGSNFYSGGTTVNGGGTLQLGDGVTNNGSVAGNITLANSSALVFANPSSQTYAGVISGNGSLTKNAAGILQLQGNHTYSGPTVINAGTVQLAQLNLEYGFGADTGSGTADGVSTPALVVVHPTNGTWTLNTYGGYGGNKAMRLTPVTGGTLDLTDGTATDNAAGYKASRSAFYNTPLPVNTSFNVSFTFKPLSLNLSDANQSNYDNGFAFVIQNDSRGASALGGAARGMGVGNDPEASANNVPIYHSAEIAYDMFQDFADAGGLIFSPPSVGGPGTGYNTNGGTGNAGYPYPVTNLAVFGGTLGTYVPGDPVNMSVNYNALTHVLTWSGTDNGPTNTSGFTTFSYSQTGVNLQTITGSSTAYFGFTGGDGEYGDYQTISNFSFAGLSPTQTNVLPSTTPLFVAAGATLDLYGVNQTVGDLSGAGVVTNTYTPSVLATLNVGNDGTTQSFSGTLQDGGGSLALTKVGSGNLILSGPNTYSGGTNINAGIVQFANKLAMSPTGTVSVAGQAMLAVNAGGTGEFTAATSGPGSIGGLAAGIGGQGAPVHWASGAILGIDATNAAGGLTYSGSIGDTHSGPLGLAELGSGILTLTGTNTYTGGTIVEGGELIIGNGNLGSDLAIDANGVGTNLYVGNAAGLAEFGTTFGSVTPADAGAGLAAGSGIAPVPEPGTLALVVAALSGAAVYRRLRRRGAQSAGSAAVVELV
jgi:autotransporter-associated beta strand protein